MTIQIQLLTGLAVHTKGQIRHYQPTEIISVSEAEAKRLVDRNLATLVISADNEAVAPTDNEAVAPSESKRRGRPKKA